MGVKHFYIWLRKNFNKCIYVQDTFTDKNIDNLCIDMNGVIHTCAQKIYEYGNHKPRFKRLLYHPKKLTLKNQLRLFDEITKHIDSYAGKVLLQEVNAIKMLTNKTKKPVTCIIGGSKISTKIGILTNFVKKWIPLL